MLLTVLREKQCTSVNPKPAQEALEAHINGRDLEDSLPGAR